MSSTCHKVYLRWQRALQLWKLISVKKLKTPNNVSYHVFYTSTSKKRSFCPQSNFSYLGFLNPDFLQLTAYSFTSWCLLLYPSFKNSVKSLKTHFVSICLKIEKLEWNQLLTSVNLPPKKTNWKIKVYKNIFTSCYVVFPGEENKP